ncbi:hypothetical protein EDB89DRAFT_1905967 [Lactarius sanguifluus]|nr:hypothetical protein EDB89DRAFT_1905967 [Lactarius sanguifluus]
MQLQSVVPSTFRWARRSVVQAIVIAILLTFIGVNSWLLTRGIPVPHALARDVPAWISIIDRLASPPVQYQLVVSLTLYRTAGALYSCAQLYCRDLPRHATGRLDFIIAFAHPSLIQISAICTVSLAFTIVVVSADPSVRGATAQPSGSNYYAPGVLVISSYAPAPTRSHGFPPRSPAARTWNDRAGDPTLTLTPAPVLGRSTSAPAPFGTVYEGKSFALEPCSSAGCGHTTPALVVWTCRGRFHAAGSHRPGQALNAGHSGKRRVRKKPRVTRWEECLSDMPYKVEQDVIQVTIFSSELLSYLERDFSGTTS